MKCRNLHRFIMLLPYITALFNIGVVQAALDNKGNKLLSSRSFIRYRSTSGSLDNKGNKLLPYITALFNIGVLQAALDNKGNKLLSSRSFIRHRSTSGCFR